MESIEKAKEFVNLYGYKADFKIITEENELTNLPEETISRRELLLGIKKSTTNITKQALDIVINDKENNLSIRNTLLSALENIDIEPQNIHNTPFFGNFVVQDECNGCGKCHTICPGNAWNVENDGEKIKIYHNIKKCYNCGICKDTCPEKAIVEEKSFSTSELLSQSLKKEINLSMCKTCSKKYIPIKQDTNICPICEKKKDLREKIAAYNSN